jgi:hypothetical protein
VVIWIRYTIGSSFGTVTQALITASARLDVNEFAILGLSNEDKFVRTEIIRETNIAVRINLTNIRLLLHEMPLIPATCNGFICKLYHTNRYPEIVITRKT